MNTSNDRLTEVENDLETVKEIMLAIARRAEATDARIDLLVQNLISTQQQIDSNTSAIAQLTQKIDQLADTQETTEAQVGSIMTAIDELTVCVDRVVDYLESQNGNGRGAA